MRAMSEVTYDRWVHVIHPTATIEQAKKIMESAYGPKQTVAWALHDAMGNVFLNDDGRQYLASVKRHIIFWGYSTSDAHALVDHFNRIAPGSPITYEIRFLPSSAFRFEAWPVAGVAHVITQAFGVNPQNYDQFGLPGHEGLDLRAPTGAKIVSVASGVVSGVYDAGNKGYGRNVRVDHQDGWQTIYAHLQAAAVVAGEHVKAEQLLGYADNTGNSSGSHLHLTLKHRGHVYTDSRGTWPSNIHDPTPFIREAM